MVLNCANITDIHNVRTIFDLVKKAQSYCVSILLEFNDKSIARKEKREIPGTLCMMLFLGKQIIEYWVPTTWHLLYIYSDKGAVLFQLQHDTH
jgi:hypothetical protein